MFGRATITLGIGPHSNMVNSAYKNKMLLGKALHGKLSLTRMATDDVDYSGTCID